MNLYTLEKTKCLDVKTIRVAAMRMVTVRVLTLKVENGGDVWVAVEKSYPGMPVLPSALNVSVGWPGNEMKIPMASTTTNSKVG